jgi:outer membrane protein assembly factor BamE (lipoprotein component of BamABCDE complex)
MPRALLAAAFAALAASLWGCAGVSAVTTGMDETQVQAKAGKPDTVRKNADGSQVWEYPEGPLGRQTFMITMGSDHTVKDIRQVMSERYFSQVKAGMSRDEVRQLLGRPGEVSMFPARDEEVWSWRYLQENAMFFNVMFDRSTGTVRTTQRLEEILFIDQDC